MTAARGGFTAGLEGWNGCVPFFIRLRRYAGERLPAPDAFIDEVAGPTARTAPPQWVHRQLADGRALLLVDGVDELLDTERPKVRNWLRQLLRDYPHTRVVITTRPAAASQDWLNELGFGAATLEPMTPADVQTFIQRWHNAVAEAGSLPCSPAEIPTRRGRLIAELEGKRHLQALATNPLLCALLCALNLDRKARLPGDRMSLYAAALEMLLERRDTERDVPGAQDLRIDLRGKTMLLQELAWYLSLEGRVDLSINLATEQVAAALATMPGISTTAGVALRHLLTRSGVIREPVVGRVDFVHRTFQEYLAAKAAADRSHAGYLVEHAHLARWRDTVIMAAGHANASMREELVGGLLSRADREHRHARALRLLAASCLETAPSLATSLQETIIDHLNSLIPPRSMTETRSLATGGMVVLRKLPIDLSGLSESAAAATVRTAALAGGMDALGVLRGYAADSREAVQKELVTIWKYYDPIEFAERVMEDSPLRNGFLELKTLTPIAGLRKLKHLSRLKLDLFGTVRIDEFGWLNDVPALTSMSAHCGMIRTLRPLAKHANLSELWLTSGGRLDLSHLSDLENLTVLGLFTDSFGGTLHDLAKHSRLTGLYLASVPDDWDFTSLIALPRLQRLSLDGNSGPSAEVIRSLPRLALLKMPAQNFDASLEELVSWQPDLFDLALEDATNIDTIEPLGRLRLDTLSLTSAPIVDISPLVNFDLTDLTLSNCHRLTSIEAMKTLGNLRSLNLDSTNIISLEPISEQKKLTSLSLSDCQSVRDLAPLNRLNNLKHLWLDGAWSGLDLSPLAGMNLTVHLLKDQDVRGYDRLGARTRIVWH